MKLENFIDMGVDFWINKAGLVTCDSYYHDILIKVFLLKNWERYSKLIDPFILFKTIGEENLGPLFFDSSGKVVKCHPFITKLVKLDNRRNFIKSLKSGNDWKILLFLIGGAITVKTINLYRGVDQGVEVNEDGGFMTIFNEITGKYKDKVQKLL